MNQCVLKPFNQSVSPVATMSQSKRSSHSSLANYFASNSPHATSPSTILAGLVIACPGTTSPSLSPTASPRQVIGGRSPSVSPRQSTHPVVENSPNPASPILVSLHPSGNYHLQNMQHKHRQSTYGSQTTLSSKGQQRWSQGTSSTGNDPEGVLAFEMSVKAIVAEEERKTGDQHSKSESLKAPQQKGTYTCMTFDVAQLKRIKG